MRKAVGSRAFGVAKKENRISIGSSIPGPVIVRSTGPLAATSKGVANTSMSTPTLTR